MRHFNKFPLIQGTITNVFNPPPLFQCCQCCCIVKTKSGELQTPRNNIEQGRGGLDILYPLKSQDILEKCEIHLSQLLLSMIVCHLQCIYSRNLSCWLICGSGSLGGLPNLGRITVSRMCIRTTSFRSFS